MVRGRGYGLSHHVVLTDGDGRKVGERGFAHGGQGLAEMAAWLMTSTGAADAGLLVAIEVPHGPVVESLMERGFRVHAINPKQLDRFRDRFSPAGAKDDSRDAEVLADALRTDPRCFRPLAPIDPTVVELREWSRIADDLRAERNRLGNRAPGTSVALLSAVSRTYRRYRRRLVPRPVASDPNT